MPLQCARSTNTIPYTARRITQGYAIDCAVPRSARHIGQGPSYPATSIALLPEIPFYWQNVIFYISVTGNLELSRNFAQKTSECPILD